MWFQWQWRRYGGEPAWFVSRPERTDITFLKQRAELCVWRRCTWTTSPGKKKKKAVTEQSLVPCVWASCVPDHPWLTNDSSEFPAALRSPYRTLAHTSRARHHESATWQVAVPSPRFHQQLRPDSPLQPQRWSEWQMTAKVWCLIALVFVCSLHCCHLSCRTDKKEKIKWIKNVSSVGRARRRLCKDQWSDDSFPHFLL